MINILYAALAIFGIGILIFVHELGHYFVARRVGMTVEAFSIGFGKAIWKKEVNGVLWQLGWIPFGGFVRIKGMEKKGNVDPSTIPDGYFGKPPGDRIKVAFAGPLANILFTLFAFTLLWAFGGREKRFSEYTQIVGWVDPHSELYAHGLRPGDQITQIDDRTFNGLRDLILSAALHEDKEQISGFQIDYQNREKAPFSYTLPLYKEVSEEESPLGAAGLLYPASYLLYAPLPDGKPPIVDGAPIALSGIEYGDRVIWADGELVFSNDQFIQMYNQPTALLTIERNGKILLAKVPRLPISEIRMSKSERNEITDLSNEVRLPTSIEETLFIPYFVDDRLIVTNPFVYLDANSQETIYRGNTRSMSKHPLQEGDRILAVDGVPIDSSSALLEALQTKRMQILVQSQSNLSPISWKLADAEFDKEISWQDFQQLITSVGIPNKSREIGTLRLLKPVAPVPLSEITEQKVDRLSLGVAMQDRKVIYNPSPLTMFYASFEEMYRTLAGLVTGSFSPKIMSGPVGIVQAIHHSFAIGLPEALYFLGFLSLNLAVLNLLPIPVLDGGHICFALYEKITKRKVSVKWMERMIIPFFILLLGFLLFLTYHDIGRIIKSFFR